MGQIIDTTPFIPHKSFRIWRKKVEMSKKKKSYFSNRTKIFLAPVFPFPLAKVGITWVSKMHELIFLLLHLKKYFGRSTNRFLSLLRRELALPAHLLIVNICQERQEPEAFESKKNDRKRPCQLSFLQWVWFSKSKLLINFQSLSLKWSFSWIL